MYTITKNNKQKIITWGLLAVLGLVVFGYMQFGWFSTSEYLISVTAEDGAVIGLQDENGCFALTLNGADHLVWFTDRPEREAGSTGIEFLVDTWSEEFGDNPPNADLQLFAENGKDVSMILVLESTPTFGEYGHTLTFDKVCPIFSSETGSDLAIENISGTTFPKAVIFIDDFLGIGKAFTALGDAISHESKHSTTAIAKKINFGNWEEHAAAHASNVVAMAAQVGGDAGKERGGVEGERVGSRVGAELGIVVVKTTAGLAFGANVDGTSLIDPHDFAEALKESLLVTADNLNLAYALAKNILEGQKDTLRASFFDSLNDLGTEYDEHTFCGQPITEDNVLFDAFMYYLELKLETRIYYDLKSGMSLDDVQSDVILNLNDDIRYSLVRALWELQYYCIFDEDDLYTHLFVQMYVINYTSANEFPELGGTSIGGEYFIPIKSVSGITRTPLSGVKYTEAELYRVALEKYYLKEDRIPSRAEIRLSVADVKVFARDRAALRRYFEEIEPSESWSTTLYQEALEKYSRENPELQPLSKIRLSVADVIAQDMEALTTQLDLAAGEPPVIVSIDLLITPPFGPVNESLTPEPIAFTPNIAQNISLTDEVVATDILLLPLPTELVTDISTSETLITFSTPSRGSISVSRNVLNYLDGIGVRNFNRVNLSDLTTKIELTMTEPVNVQFELAVISDTQVLGSGEIVNPYGSEYVADSVVVDDAMIAEIIEVAVEEAIVETVAEDAAI